MIYGRITNIGLGRRFLGKLGGVGMEELRNWISVEPLIFLLPLPSKPVPLSGNQFVKMPSSGQHNTLFLSSRACPELTEGLIVGFFVSNALAFPIL